MKKITVVAAIYGLCFTQTVVGQGVDKGIPVVSSQTIYGESSYYGEYWNGRTTANMEIFDCDKITCASPSLPFNTMLKVTNIDNNKSVVVRVNDRGPYKMDDSGKALMCLEPHPTRVLDLSRATFKKIGKLSKGVINIKYKIVKKKLPN